MKSITLIISILLSLNFLNAQNAIQVHLNKEGHLKIELIEKTEQSKPAAFNTSLEWIQYNKSELEGKITYQNSNTGHIVFKAHKNINLSKSTSTFQTRMFFTLYILANDNKLMAEVKDIYYKSIPEYGKQGTPAIISYTEDWLQKEKYYKKNGEIRWLNQYLKNSSIEAGNQILSSLQNRF
ncbi:MAG: DUF4468 domain-containing protein [Marinifilaceae bacterium]